MWQEVIQAASAGGGPIKIKTFPDVDNRNGGTTSTFSITYEGDAVAVIVTAEAYTTSGTRATAYDSGMVWVSDFAQRQMGRQGASFNTTAVPAGSAAYYPTIESWEGNTIKFRVGNNANYARAVYHPKVYYI